MSKKGNNDKAILATFRGNPEVKKHDTTPVAMPLGYCEPTPLQDLIASMVREAVVQEKGQEYETLEEADDFDITDEELLDLSPYELTALEDEPIFTDAEPEPTPTPEPEPTKTSDDSDNKGDDAAVGVSSDTN